MVRVVSDKPVKTKKIICPNCGYELEYTGEDVESYEYRDYGAGDGMKYFITCPRKSCVKRIFVSEYETGEY